VEIFGYPLKDYSIRIEFQARGSPHAHCLIWLEGAPNFNTPEGIEFIDINVSCSLQTEAKEFVLKYQSHRHSSTCFKKKNSTYCRFAFPKKACEKTTIIDDADIDDNGGRFVDLKRAPDETMINNYHPVLLHILKCNMDIQPVTGAMAIAFYIAKYMSKPEPAEIRNQIQTSMDSIMKSNLTAQQKMNRIAMTLMKNREISAQEASFRLCHLFLKKSSRVCVFVPAFLQERRLRMVRLETIGNDPKFCLNIIDRYMFRPVALENLCLFEFAAYYKPYVSKRRQEESNYDADVEEFNDGQLDEVEGKCLCLLEDKGKIVKRKFAAIVKYPNFDIEKESQCYYYCLLLMYMPFRQETFCNAESPAKVFEQRYTSFRKHSDDNIINPEMFNTINQALLRVAEYTVQDEMEQHVDHEHDETIDLPLTAEEVFNIEPAELEQGEIVEQIKIMFSKLSEEQRAVFLEVDRAMKTNDSEAIRLIVCGEGGTGKSYLIRLLSLLIRNFYTPDSLIISAPTGKAAFNVHGTTLHRSFALPVQLGNIGTYYRLGSRKLEELRNLYNKVKFIFIDEFSMVSYENIRMVHNRLCEIFQAEDPYANKNIILFGDLMQLKPPRGAWIFQKPTRYL
jgi:hypothetical protein